MQIEALKCLALMAFWWNLSSMLMIIYLHLYEERGDQSLEGKVDWKGRPARKGVHGGVPFSLMILALFGFESLASVAPQVNLVTYFNGVMHFDIATASNMLTNLLGTSYILAVAVAYFADVFIGRYRAALIFACVEFLGFMLLTVQAAFPSLMPPLCNIYDPTSACVKVGGRNAALLYISLYLIAVGMSGVKAGVPPHGADQFDEDDPQEASRMSSFFNWLLLSACIGAALSFVFIVWIQTDVGWKWGFGVSTMAMFLGVLIFAAGIPRYRIHVIKETNPITELIQVYVAAIRNRNLQLPESPEELYEIDLDKENAAKIELVPHRNIFKFLDKAAIQTSPELGSFKPETPSSWKLCRVTQVENAKTILGMLPIFASSIIMNTVLAQLQTFTVQQGLTMDTWITKSIKIPPATLPIIPVSFLVIIVPIYDVIIVPLLRKHTGHATGITHLQRIGVGLLLSCLSMATAALVEVKRKDIAKDRSMLDAIPVLQPLPISVFWLSFQYFIFGIADMFTFVVLLEFFYSEAPKKMKSIATSFTWCSMSLGYFLSSALVEIVNHATEGMTKSGGWLAGNNLNRNHLNLFYWLLAVLSFINFLNYLFWARRYEYKPQHSIDSERKPEA